MISGFPVLEQGDGFLYLWSNSAIGLHEKKQKVFCAGFQKTGTTLVEAALSMPGYKVTSIFGKALAIDELPLRYVARGLEITQDYDAVQDMTCPLLWVLR